MKKYPKIYCKKCGSCAEGMCCYPTKCKFVQSLSNGKFIKPEGLHCQKNLLEFIRRLKWELNHTAEKVYGKDKQKWPKTIRQLLGTKTRRVKKIKKKKSNKR